MIKAIGTDIVSIIRIEKLFQKYNDKFVTRILGANECEIFYNSTNSRKISYLAKRFAAKEAISKSLGQGIGRGLDFKDIEILNNDLGAPYVNINSCDPKIVKISKNINITISDEYPFAIAFAVIFSED